MNIIRIYVKLNLNEFKYFKYLRIFLKASVIIIKNVSQYFETFAKYFEVYNIINY